MKRQPSEWEKIFANEATDTYLWNLKKNDKMNLFTKQKQTHRHRKQTYGYQRGEGWGQIRSLGLIYTHYYI